jgi:WD40 repeat protein/tRNA A-37 threonylcarbamoyl transferase component Bud32
MSTTGKTERERRLDEIATAYLQEIERGQAPRPAEWLARYPDLAEELAAFFAAQDQVAQLAAPLRAAAAGSEAATHAPSAAPPGSLGTVRYFGDYELLEEIARGGMGVVYKARQTKLDRIVAVKMILAGELANRADVERFYTEARAAANLHHPNIVPIHEVGQHQGQHYFSMDYVAGESLASRIARGPLPAREAATLLVKVARAVAFAHVDGVIHRDLKPANILLDAQGEPHITDFGLAKRVESAPGAAGTKGVRPPEERGLTPFCPATLTETGQVLGTASYMPPEQAGGRSKDIGPRSDVYSLGAVLYCALTARPPFQAASTLDTLLQVLDREPVSPRTLNASVPRDLETICLKCLEKDSRRRYGTAQELADECQRYLDGKPILARPVGRLERTWRWCRRNPALAAMTAMAVQACITGMVISILFALQAREQAAVSADLAVKADELATKWKQEAGRATHQEGLTRRYLYSAHLNLAHDALKASNLLRTVELLDQHRPAADHDDLRSFEWRYLWRECHRWQRAIPLTKGATVGLVNAHREAAVLEFVVSRDGRWVAVAIMAGSSDVAREVRLVDLATGTLRKSFVGRPIDKNWPAATDTVFRHLAFSADSKRLAMVRWDYEVVKEVISKGVTSMHQKPVSPRLTVWDVETLAQRAEIPLGDFRLTDRIAISSTAVAAGYGEPDKLYPTIKVWDLPRGKGGAVGAERILPKRDKPRRGKPSKHGGSEQYRCFQFTPDGKTLAWGNYDFAELILSNLSDATHRVLPLTPYYLAFSPDGKHFANWAGEKAVKLYDTRAGKQVAEFSALALLRSGEGLSMDTDTIRFSQDNRILAFGRGLSAALWDVVAKKQVGEVRWPSAVVRAVGFGADSQKLITVLDNNEARFWDIHTRPGPEDLALGKPPLPKLPLGANPGPELVAGLAAAPGARMLAAIWGLEVSGPGCRGVYLYDLPPAPFAKPVAELPAAELATKRAKDLEPVAVTLSRDATRLAVSGIGRHHPSLPHTVQLWKIARGAKTKATLERTLLAPSSPHEKHVPAVALSPDGTKLAHATCQWAIDPNPSPHSGSDLVQLHDLASGKDRLLPADAKAWFEDAAGLVEIQDWHYARSWCAGAVFSSDGKRLFTAHISRSTPWAPIIAWDTATGNILAVLQAPASGIAALALAPDDRTLAVSHGDRIRLWDVSLPALAAVRAKLKQQADLVRNGKGQRPSEPAAAPNATLRGQSDQILTLAFHPDGKILASGGADGTIKLWDLVTGEMRLTLEGQVPGLVLTGLHTATTPALLAFTPDGDGLLYGTRSGTLKLWRGTAAPVRSGP